VAPRGDLSPVDYGTGYMERRPAAGRHIDELKQRVLEWRTLWATIVTIIQDKKRFIFVAYTIFNLYKRLKSGPD